MSASRKIRSDAARSERRRSNDLKRAAAYIRVSTGMQAEEGESLPAQQARLQKWAKENGYIIVAEYVDAGESARTVDRREFTRMLQDAKGDERPFDAILVWKWDRFARNVDDSSMYKALLRKRLGIELISITQPNQGGAVGLLMERMLDVIAEFSSMLTAENVHSTMSYLAEKDGRWMGKVPFGYLLNEGTGRLDVKEDEAEAVRWAFERVAKRETSVYAIAEEFATGSRFPCTVSRGYKWSPTAVRKILQNEVYTGRVVWNRRKTEIDSVDGVSRKVRSFRDESEWITKDEAHEALIEEAVFDTVQRVLSDYSARYPKTPRGEYLFRGMVRCARCGYSLTWYAPNNGTKPRLACSQYFRTPSVACRPMNYIPPKELEEAVLAWMEAIIKDDVPELDIATPKRAKVTTPEALLEANQQKVHRLLDAYEAGAITLDDLKSRRAILDQEAERLRTAMADDDGQPDYEGMVTSLRERIVDVLGVMRDEEVPVGQKNEALLSVIDQIVVDRDAKSVRIRWRLDDEE